MREKLEKLFDLLPMDIQRSFNLPAAEGEIADLENLPLSLPDPLTTLFRWRNGQQWNAALSKQDNRRIMSIRETIEQFNSFNDPEEEFLQPWQPTWLPLLTNDAGDYLVIETAGADPGKIITYWHDWEQRSVAYPSLEAWIDKLIGEYENQ